MGSPDLQQFLKEILNELCVYNKRGANQGTYELKPEYKKSVVEEDTGAEWVYFAPYAPIPAPSIIRY